MDCTSRVLCPIHLKFQLLQHYIRKSPKLSLAEYLHMFKQTCDSLAGIGKPVDDREKVFSLLTGLGSSFKSFTTAMLQPPYALLQ